MPRSDDLLQTLKISSVPYVPQHTLSDDSLHLMNRLNVDGLEYCVTIDPHSKYGKLSYDPATKEFSLLFLQQFNFVPRVWCPLPLKSFAIHLVDPASTFFSAKIRGDPESVPDIFPIDVSQQTADGFLDLPKLCISGVHSVPYRPIKFVFSYNTPEDQSKYSITVYFIGLKNSEAKNELNSLFDSREKMVDYLKKKHEPTESSGLFSYIGSFFF